MCSWNVSNVNSRGRSWFAAALMLVCGWAQAGMAVTKLPASGTDGPVTVYYPSSATEQPVTHVPFTLSLAENGPPVRGNGRLVMISHGSGGNAWVHADLARVLVEAGFVVAMPQHHADHSGDPSNPGPQSWAIRPQEVSRAIDAMGRDHRFAPLLALDRVGVYGMSAGGHTALSMAGGRWSIAGFKNHCEAHLVEDFQSCVGLITRLKGGLLDGIKQWAALAVIRYRFADETLLSHDDDRVAAVVAGVPAAADFDMASLAKTRVPLGLVTAGQDRWLIPRFHSDRVLQACTTCEHLADLPTAGHGALLSPLPPGMTGLLGDMLNDPPGFERSQMHGVNQAIAAFFVRHLLPQRR